MLRFFRHIRKTLMEQNKVRTYLQYAVGEIILVVIGILIALQINNWNQNRLEKELFWGYLQNIHSNIESDLNKGNDLNFKLDQISNNSETIIDYKNRSTLTYWQFATLTEHINTLESIGLFKSNRSGFNALSNTGSVRLLQGTDMEKLLYIYYDHMFSIEYEFDRKAHKFDELFLEISKRTWGYRPSDLLKRETNPLTYEPIEAQLLEKMNSSIMESLLSLGFENNFSEDYLKMEVLAEIIMDMIENETLYTDQANLQKIEFFHVDYSNEALPDIVVNGSFPSSIELLTASNMEFENVQQTYESDFQRITFKDSLLWGAALFLVDSLGVIGDRPIKDYSNFSFIELELRGKNGGEQIQFAIKDRDDPDDGSESKVSLQLTSKCISCFCS